MRKIILIKVFLLALCFSLISCLSSRLERKLKPEDANWLSEVRYIISSEERKIFLELPESEREKFKEEFWQRRDPDPDTEENEFRDEYYRRLKIADQMFRGEGRPGWQTDRGRIFILFGPPTDRQTFPMEAGGYCREIWYYGNFPVIFIDQNCTGNFVMVAINLKHLQDLNLAEGYFQKTITQENSFFNYDLKLKKLKRTANSLQAVLAFDIKYEQIWFETLDDGSLKAELLLTAEVKDSKGQVVWSGQQTMPLSFRDEKELKALRERKFISELEINLPDGQHPLPAPGKYFLYSTLRQAVGEKELKKVAEIKL
ncbi:MAG: GWxTD domain-containing protein [Candidatus Saccharicenans sp.]